MDSDVWPVRSIKKRPFLAHLKFENRSRKMKIPDSSNHSLYLTKLAQQRGCYPEGNFGGNQLLDSSMSLSPLYPNSTNDLHVSTATSLQRSFLRLRSIQEKITIFRVPAHVLQLISFSSQLGTAPLATDTRRRGSEVSLFQSALWFRSPQHSHKR